MRGLQDVIHQASTDPRSESDSGEAERKETEYSLADVFQMDHEVTPEPVSLAGRYGMEQLEDPNLTTALQQVTMWDGKPL